MLPAQLSLHSAYSNIRHQCNERALGWPHAEGIRASFREDEHGILQPPAFEDGHGPIGVYAMLQDNADAMAVLRWCQAAFDDITASLCQVLTPTQQEQLMGCLRIVPDERSLHTCVSVFHEHPSLLKDDEQRAAWRAVDQDLAHSLATALSACHATSARPLLALDSLSLTADGALIAGFVDDEVAAFGELRTSSSDVGVQAIGGTLTSRPKTLIHVTLGRLLGRPDDMSDEQDEAFAAKIRRFNSETLPQMVARSSPRTFELRACSLVRDSVWLMTDFIEYARWPLGPSRNGEHE